MTLVAAYRVNEVPFLLGDLLITGGGKVGARKKVHRIRKDLVVGWTGDLVAAQVILDKINEEVDEKGSFKSLSKSLKSVSKYLLGSMSVILVGWVVDSEPRCFRWNSDWPHEIFFGEFFYDGTGAEKFQKLNGGEVSHELNKPNREQVLPQIMALENVCYLMADEVDRKQKYRNDGYGFGYEILYLTENGFEYIEDILYVICEVWFDDEGNYLGPKLFPSVHSYHNESDFSVIQETSFGHGSFLEPQDICKSTHHINRHLVKPVHHINKCDFDSTKKEVSSTSYKSSFDADYVCLFSSLIQNGHLSDSVPFDPLIMISYRNEDRSLFKVFSNSINPEDPKQREISFQFPSSEIYELTFKEMCKSRIRNHDD